MEHIGRMDLRGFRYEFSGIAVRPQCPAEWAAVFDVFTAEGKPLDGPVVFTINGTTGEVRILGE